jgi:benzoyl-CoA reductase subunit B
MTVAQKDRSMLLQKEMIAGHFARLEKAPENHEPVVYTFVPGNLVELIRSFGALPVLPEINALQSGMRKLSGDYIAEAERLGHSEDVCAYVKCDIGMLRSGNIGPAGTKLPKPDLLLLSYTGCYTFMKWFELLREEYDCPAVFFHVPYQGDGVLEPEHREYMLRQLREQVIPALERATGRAYDEDALRERLTLAAEAEDHLVAVLQSAKHKPSPIDGYFGTVYYVGPIFSAFRGTPEGVGITARAREIERVAAGRVRDARGPARQPEVPAGGEGPPS